MSIADLPYRTTIFGGTVDIGDIGVRAVGVLWLLTGTAFVALAIAIGAGVSWWFSAVLLSTAASATVCLVEWPQARAGLWANAVVAVITVVAQGVAAR
jgi:hypothetical protein